MILNRKYGFLFIKTMKTAGTSLEIALSSLCGSEDIITPITDDDEQKRRDLGFPGPRNFAFGQNPYLRPDRPVAAPVAKRGFYNHIPASHLRVALGKDFDRFFKFSIIRNPWDRMVSQYFYFTHGVPESQRPSLKEFMRNSPGLVNANERILFDLGSDEVLADAVLYFENLQGGLAKIQQGLGIECDLFEMMGRAPAKTQFRPKTGRNYNLFCEYADTLLATLCRREIECFNYSRPFEPSWQSRSGVPAPHLPAMSESPSTLSS
jgi:hypothetical protein